MNILDRVYRLFPTSPVPLVLVEGAVEGDTDREDATNFSGIPWPKITLDHWQKNSGAYWAFTPNSFIYYLPSIIVLSTSNSIRNFIAADFLLSSLDTSANYEYWSDFIVDRFSKLNSSQYDFLYDWVQEVICPANMVNELSCERIALTILAMDEHFRLEG